MKVYIKSSFGYHDKDWVDPEDEPGYEYHEILIEFDKELVSIKDDDLQFINYKFKDFYDEEYYDYGKDVLILSSNEILDRVIEVLDDYLPEISGDYTLSGWISIPYQIEALYNGRNSYEWEEFEPDVIVKDVTNFGEINFEAVK